MVVLGEFGECDSCGAFGFLREADDVAEELLESWGLASYFDAESLLEVEGLICGECVGDLHSEFEISLDELMDAAEGA